MPRHCVTRAPVASAVKHFARDVLISGATNGSHWAAELPLLTLVSDVKRSVTRRLVNLIAHTHYNRIMDVCARQFTSEAPENEAPGLRNGSNIQGLRKADRIRAKLKKILARHTPPPA